MGAVGGGGRSDENNGCSRMVYSELSKYCTFGFGALSRPAVPEVESTEQRKVLHYKTFQFFLL